jgi:hypothetical protein
VDHEEGGEPLAVGLRGQEEAVLQGLFQGLLHQGELLLGEEEGHDPEEGAFVQAVGHPGKLLQGLQVGLGQGKLLFQLLALAGEALGVALDGGEGPLGRLEALGERPCRLGLLAQEGQGVLGPGGHPFPAP